MALLGAGMSSAQAGPGGWVPGGAAAGWGPSKLMPLEARGGQASGLRVGPGRVCTAPARMWARAARAEACLPRAACAQIDDVETMISAMPSAWVTAQCMAAEGEVSSRASV